MTSKNALMKRLDLAAEKLLDRYFGEVVTDKPTEGQDQIKAFDAVVRYFGPRTKQSDEEKNVSPFEQLQRGLNGGKTPRRARGESRQNVVGDDAGDGTADA